MEKGASSWLSVLPIKAIGYALNKQEFTDVICMRYGWKVKGIPTHCACGETNSVDYSLICKLGGYTSMRHNSVRDSEGITLIGGPGGLCFQMEKVNFRRAAAHNTEGQDGGLHKKGGPSCCGKRRGGLQKRAALRPVLFRSPA